MTLDGSERAMTADDLLICDANEVPIGVGGIMGGLHSEITDATTVVALEVAWFEPNGIAQSVGRLGLRSEASTRFERGVDPYGIDRSIARFVELLRETCPRRRPRWRSPTSPRPRPTPGPRSCAPARAARPGCRPAAR